jgi:hypothetical protein
MNKLKSFTYGLIIFTTTVWVCLTFEWGLSFCAGAGFALTLRLLINVIHQHRSTTEFMNRIRNDKYEQIFSKKEELSKF